MQAPLTDNGTRTFENDISSEIDILLQRFKALNSPRVNFSGITKNPALAKKYYRKYGDAQMLRKGVLQYTTLMTSNTEGDIHGRLELIHRFFREFALDQSKDHSLAALAKEIDTAFLEYESHLSEIEICRKDVEQWSKYRISGYGLEFFSYRLRVFLAGGVLTGAGERGEQVQMKGLRSLKFGFSLATQIEQNPRVRRLLLYPSVMEFVKKMDKTVKTALNDGKWQGFYGKDGFYNNLKKGKNYISLMREKLGYDDIASFLEKLDLEIHEDAPRWERELFKIQEKMGDFTYQNQNIFGPALQELGQLLQNAERMGTTKKGLESHIREMLDSLGRKITEAEGAIKGEIEGIRKVFLDLDDAMSVAVGDIKKEMEMFDEEIVGLRSEERAHLERSIQRRERALSSLKANVRNLLSGRQGGGLLEASAIDESFFAIRSAANDNESVGIAEKMRELSRRVEGIFMHLRKVIAFIEPNDKRFTIPLSRSTELLPEVKVIVEQKERA